MDRVLGIIAEYNPFHNGHLSHLKQSKKLTNSKYTIAVMNGHFTQRGETSIVNKWEKTKMALENGIDLVIELPLIYSISSAENFAYGSIKILDSLNIVDTLSFGAEYSDIKTFNKISDLLVKEPTDYKNELKNNLNTGLSFAKSRENAIINFLGNNQDYIDILSNPNNILAIEYIKALKKLNSKIIPYSVKRTNNYNSQNIQKNITSGTSIRNALKENKIELLSEVMPISSYKILNKNLKNNQLVYISNFEKLILFKLRELKIDEIANLPDVNEGLEHLIKKAANSSSNLDDLIEKIKSKRYTRTRIQRIVLYALLGITKKDMEISKQISPYIRVLGFNENGKKLLSKITKENPNLEIITSVKKFEDTCKNKDLKNMLQKDILSSNIYTLGYEKISEANLDYTKKLIINS